MFRTRARSVVPVSARLSARLGAAGVAAVLVLGGCSGSGAEPDAEAAEQKVTSSASPSGSASPSEAATPTVTPTPTPTAAAYKPATAEGPAENVPLPVMPELAKEKSKEGLEAFAEYWYSLINYGYETGDPEPLREITGSDCSLKRTWSSMALGAFTMDQRMVSIHRQYS
ncbi:DUF6318 family protein [Arthrobacter sp. UYP6]|uniref:DUF6318 family protein n=1 Tax=Arthrobacter sp. UYP6 TaxID=1756378 RepID=UPI0033966188